MKSFGYILVIGGIAVLLYLLFKSETGNGNGNGNGDGQTEVNNIGATAF